MNQDYIQKLYSEYTSQRNAMHDASLEAAGRYDRAVLSITTGALAVSIAFLDKIVKEPDERTIPLLILAWLILVTALICELLALSSSQKSCQLQIEILDEEYKGYLYSGDPEAAVTNRQPPSENTYVLRTHRYSSVALWSLIVGIILMMAFSATNIYINGGKHDRKTKIKQQRKHRRPQYQGKLYAGEKQVTPTAPTKK